jgi:hypothetical protein
MPTVAPGKPPNGGFDGGANSELTHHSKPQLISPRTFNELLSLIIEREGIF